MKEADLHIHTTYSDGTCSPEEVVKIAKEKGLSAIAITDHDITDGLCPAIKMGAKIGIEVIPGIELSCEYNSVEIHILGYYINWENSWFQTKLKVFQKARERRAYYILNKLRALGYDIDEHMLMSKVSLGSVSRLHFARCLEEMGAVDNIKEAFDKFLGAGRPAFVRKLRITPEEALNMIHRVGGVSVVAHPVFGGSHKNFLKKLKRLGLSGIEAYHPYHPLEKTKKYIKYADDLGLVVTGGTDSHGLKEKENPIGSMRIDYAMVEDIKRANSFNEHKNRVILSYPQKKAKASRRV
ncbi:MAG: PHP domain-containing protein [Elusimicrobiota bacterium]|nr:PHP domain-containing protein [Elusimicrobiota bacterium]